MNRNRNRFSVLDTDTTPSTHDSTTATRSPTPSGKPNIFNVRSIKLPTRTKAKRKAFSRALNDLTINSKVFDNEMTTRPSIMVDGRAHNGWRLSEQALRKQVVISNIPHNKTHSKKERSEQIKRALAASNLDNSIIVDGIVFNRSVFYSDPSFQRALRKLYTNMTHRCSGVSVNQRDDTGLFYFKFYFADEKATPVAKPPSDEELFETAYRSATTCDQQDALKPPRGYSDEKLDRLKTLFRKQSYELLNADPSWKPLVRKQDRNDSLYVIN